MDLTRLAILIVDDNRFMREILRSILQGLGARNLHEVGDGAEALERCKQVLPEIVLLDWVLPVLSGIEILKLIRTRSTSPVPFADVIMVTAHADRGNVLDARAAGVTEFIAKPVSPQILRDRLHRCLVSPRPFIETQSYFGPLQSGFDGIDASYRLVQRPPRRVFVSPGAAGPAPRD